MSHTYGSEWAVQDVSLVRTGPGIVGLLGSNGAGKSTCMNILCGALRPTSGDVLVGGNSILKEVLKVKADIGFLPQNAPLHNEFTVREYLLFAARLRGLTRPVATRSSSRVISLCGLGQMQDRLIRNLSGGYRQRVGIAQAIVHKPKIVVLDEPTNGLDPEQIVSVRRLAKTLSENCLVFICTHAMPEVKALCSDIILIADGRVRFDGSISEFRRIQRHDTLRISVANKHDIGRIMQSCVEFETLQIEPYVVEIRFDAAVTPKVELLQMLPIAELSIKDLHFVTPTVEDAFLHRSSCSECVAAQ